MLAFRRTIAPDTSPAPDPDRRAPVLIGAALHLLRGREVYAGSLAAWSTALWLSHCKGGWRLAGTNDDRGYAVPCGQWVDTGDARGFAKGLRRGLVAYEAARGRIVGGMFLLPGSGCVADSDAINDPRLLLPQDSPGARAMVFELVRSWLLAESQWLDELAQFADDGGFSIEPGEARALRA